jgi:hypothetical protein
MIKHHKPTASNFDLNLNLDDDEDVPSTLDRPPIYIGWYVDENGKGGKPPGSPGRKGFPLQQVLSMTNGDYAIVWVRVFFSFYSTLVSLALTSYALIEYDQAPPPAHNRYHDDKNDHATSLWAYSLCYTPGKPTLTRYIVHID